MILLAVPGLGLRSVGDLALGIGKCGLGGGAGEGGLGEGGRSLPPPDETTLDSEGFGVCRRGWASGLGGRFNRAGVFLGGLSVEERCLGEPNANSASWAPPAPPEEVEELDDAYDDDVEAAPTVSLGCRWSTCRNIVLQPTSTKTRLSSAKVSLRGKCRTINWGWRLR